MIKSKKKSVNFCQIEIKIYRLQGFPIEMRLLRRTAVHFSCCQLAIAHNHPVVLYRRSRVALQDIASERLDDRHSEKLNVIISKLCESREILAIAYIKEHFSLKWFTQPSPSIAPAWR